MVQTSLQETGTGVQQGNILDKAVLLSLSIHRFGISKKVKSSEVTTDASPEMIKVSKRILASGEYDAIVKADQGFTGGISDLALPSLFRAGVYAVPLALVERVDGIIQRHIVARKLLIDAFLRVYQSAIQEAEISLGSLYDAANYPSAESVRSKFGIGYKYVATSTPERLKEIRADIYQRESEKARMEVQSLAENVKAVLREAVRDLLAHAVDRLQPKADGTAKIFRDSLIGNVKDFLSTFADRNIASDSELELICKQISDLVSGISPDTLRADANLRAEVASTFDSIKVTLDGMLTDQAARKFTFDE